MRDLKEAIALIRSKKPVLLDITKDYRIKDEEKGIAETQILGFADDEKFVISLPAWVFRALEEP